MVNIVFISISSDRIEVGIKKSIQCIFALDGSYII